MTEQDQQILRLQRKAELYRQTLQDLTERIDLVFNNDWGHTISCFQSIEMWVSPGETFLETAKTLDEEGNNWANRSVFLSSYYNAIQILEEAKAAPFYFSGLHKPGIRFRFINVTP